MATCLGGSADAFDGLWSQTCFIDRGSSNAPAGPPSAEEALADDEARNEGDTDDDVEEDVANDKHDVKVVEGGADQDTMLDGVKGVKRQRRAFHELRLWREWQIDPGRLSAYPSPHRPQHHAQDVVARHAVHTSQR